MAAADDKGGNGALYKVVGQRPDVQLGEAGGFTQGYLISIQTTGGHSGQVFVPAAQYSVGAVQPLLRDLAEQLEAVGKLTG